MVHIPYLRVKNSQLIEKYFFFSIALQKSTQNRQLIFEMRF